SRQRSNLEAACRAAGFAPQIVAETSDLGVTVELIRQQIGVAILPQAALAGADAVVQLTLTRPRLERRLLLALATGTSPPAVRASPVAVTAGPGLRPRLSVLVESGPDAGTRVAAGLSEDELRALPSRPGGIADITTYPVRGARQYAVVLDPRAAPSLLFTGVT